jgi:hypothetical protein
MSKALVNYTLEYIMAVKKFKIQTNTQAFYITKLITPVKSFMLHTPGACTIKNITASQFMDLVVSKCVSIR